MSTLDLSGINKVGFDVYASRTGSNLKFGLHNVVKISNADIDDENMADITDWVDADDVNGVSSQVTFDSKSCVKLDSGAAHIATKSSRSQDIGSMGTSTVFSFNIYFETLGTNANGDGFEFQVFNGTHYLSVNFHSDNLYVNGSIVGTNPIVLDVWQEWTFKVTWGSTVDIYLDKELFESGVDCDDVSAATNGITLFAQFGSTTANCITYIDWFKAGSNFESGDTTEITPNITDANTWQTVVWDLSGVDDADKNNIDKFIITVVNADAANTFYVDNFRTNPGYKNKVNGVSPIYIAGIMGVGTAAVKKVMGAST